MPLFIIPKIALLKVQTSTAGGDSVTGASEQTFATTGTIPANTATVGTRYRIRAFGTYGSFSTPGSVTVKVKFGSTVVAATASFANTASMSGRGWTVDVDVIVRTAGASGVVQAGGWADLATASKNSLACEMPSQNTAAIDFTAAITAAISITQTNSNAANAWTMDGLSIEAGTV